MPTSSKAVKTLGPTARSLTVNALALGTEKTLINNNSDKQGEDISDGLTRILFLSQPQRVGLPQCIGDIAI